jgi:hypothetical protein
MILIAPVLMQRFSKRLFPRASRPLQDLPPGTFRLYGIVEVIFGILLGGFFLYTC